MQHEHLYQLAVEQVADYAIFIIEPRGRVASWNAGVRHVLRWDEADWIGQPISVIFPPEDAAKGDPEAELEKARQQGCAEDDRWHVRRDGTKFWSGGITTALRDKHGNLTGFLKVMRDLTERKRAEERQAIQLAVTTVLAEAPELPDAVPKLLEAICNASAWRWGALWGLDRAAGVLRLVNLWHEPTSPLPEFQEVSRTITFAPGVGLPGRVWASGTPAWATDVSREANFPRREAAVRAGLHGAMCFPASWRGEVLAVIEFFSGEVRPPDEPLLGMMSLVGGEIGQFIDRKTTEERLRASEARYAAGVEAALDCIISMDHRGLLTEWNPAAERTFGYGRDEALGRELASLIIPPALRDAHRQGLARYLSTGEGPVVGRRFEIDAVRKDGTELPVELSITRLPSRGAPAFTGYLRDITERKRAEEALRESEELVRTIAENSTQGLAMMDARGYCTYANRACLDMTGYSAEDIRSKPLHDLIHHHYPDGRLYPKDECPIDRALPENFDVRAHEDLFFRTDGSTFPVLVAASPIFKDGTPMSTVVEIRDVTEAKRAEADRERLLESERAARVEAERASRMKDEFLATLSHELRTPLNAILGWSQILKRGTHGDDEDFAEGLRVIERNARAQTQIIEDLLDMSRIISGKVRLDVQRVDLAAVVREAVATAKPSADAKGIRLQAVLDPHAGPVSGDPARLQQVMWNLLTNAVKFTPKLGRIQVLLERVNSHVEVSVIDTGEGIKPEFLPHVFDRFRQADATTTRRHGGLGLGLSIVKQLVELHGGSVRVKSAGVGQGATFTVSLPLTVIHPEPEPNVERRHPRVASSTEGLLDACVQMGGVKVLVVDDEPDARSLVKRLLEDCHAQVFTAASAAEAINLVRAEKPDVLVCDIGMPDEDGYSLMRRVRGLGPEQGGNIPAAALTAYARAEDRVKAVLAGFQMHLAKPIEPSELIVTVASLSGRTPANGQSIEES